MLFLYFQILVLLLVSISVCALSKNKLVAIVLSILFGLFLTLQLVSMNMDGNLIDYRFYEHINLKDIWSVKDFFLTQILIFSAVFIITCAFLYFISRWAPSLKFPKWILGLSIVIGIVIMCVPQGPLNNIYSIANLKTAKSKTFNSALKDLGIDPTTYVTADKITATPGKNIIVLSLESLERGYLEPPLQNLTPTLQSIAQNNTYFDMRENLGSRWTSGSIYTSITGFPSLFRSSSNEIFQTTTASKISSVGDVLKAAGYKPTYLMGNKEFSGVSDMLTALGFEVKSEKDFEKQYPKVNWGLHDKDLFTEAKKEIAVKSKDSVPFALFMSTISGHFPNGIYDKRMESILPKQDSDIEFMASAVDYYIKDLLNFLEEENLLKNTSIYIFPDHQLMGGNTGVVKKFSKERGLYLITTADEKDISLKTSQPIYQIDIPRVIIDGAKIKTNALFLTDFIKGEKTPKYIRQHQNKILALNEASLKTLKPAIKSIDYTKGITLALNKDQNIEIGSATDIDQKNYISDIIHNKLYIVDFDEDMHNYSYRILGGDYKKKRFKICF